MDHLLIMCGQFVFEAVRIVQYSHGLASYPVSLRGVRRFLSRKETGYEAKPWT